MIIRRNSSEEWRSVETSTRKLSYSLRFKEILSKSPDVLRQFKRIMEVLDTEDLPQDEVVDSPLLRVERLQARGLSNWFKVSVGGENFFMKSEYRDRMADGVGGVREVQSTKHAADIFKDMSGVEVIPCVAGYEDKNRVYYVAEWEERASPDSENLSTYLRKLNNAVDLEEDVNKKEELLTRSRNIQARVSEIKRRLRENNFFDSDPYSDGKNTVYDTERDVIMLFDLNKKL